MRQVSIAVAQPLVTPGDVAANIRAMEPLVAEAARRGAKLVLFSECGVTGYDLKGVGAGRLLSLDDPALDRIAALARTQGVVIVAGLNERAAEKLFNTAVVFFPDGRRVVQRKHNLMPPERQAAPVAAAPRERTMFEVAGLRFAILICSDDGIPGIYAELAAAGCDVVLLPTAGAGSVSLGFQQRELADPERRRKYLEVAASCISRDGVERCLELNHLRRRLQPIRLESGDRLLPSGRQFDHRPHGSRRRRDSAAVRVRASAAGIGRRHRLGHASGGITMTLSTGVGSCLRTLLVTTRKVAGPATPTPIGCIRR